MISSLEEGESFFTLLNTKSFQLTDFIIGPNFIIQLFKSYM